MTRMYFQYTDVCTVGKKIILTFAIIFILQNKAFTQFEMNLTIPVGASFISPYAEGGEHNFLVQLRPYYINYEGITESKTGINTGVLMQIGYSFDLKNETGVTSISLLADIGYSLEASGANFIEVPYLFNYDFVSEKLTLFNTLNLGIMPKINIYIPNATPFSIGLGGGIKIPFSGKRYLTTQSGEKIEESLSYQDIRKTFQYPFIPYIKLTADTYFYVSEKLALTLGAYMSYNFGMQYDTDKLNIDGSLSQVPAAFPYKFELTEYSYTSFDIGLSFGISFGRPDPRPKKEAL